MAEFDSLVNAVKTVKLTGEGAVAVEAGEGHQCGLGGVEECD
jgi:hypothetical protein